MNDLAGEIINYLTSRTGFDHWWDNIDPIIQEEIIEDIGAMLPNTDLENKVKNLENELLALQMCGVDNWEGYSEAMECVSEWENGNNEYLPYS